MTAHRSTDRDRERRCCSTRAWTSPCGRCATRTSTTASATRSRTPGRSRRSTCTPTSPTWPRLSPAERHLVSRLVAFFATGDTIVANNLVLNLYQHVNSPEARLYLSRQLFEEAVHVQFYLTLLDTYVPDESERPRRSPRSRTSRRSGARPSSASAGSTRSASCASCETRGRPAGVPAQPDLLRRLHRGAVLLRRVRLRLLPALARPAQRPGRRAPTGCSATSRCTWRSPSTSSRPSAPRSRTCSTTSWPSRCARCSPRRSSARSQFAEDLLGEGVSGLSLADMREYLQHVADRRLAQLGIEPIVRLGQPVRVHGAAGRAGAVELLRAAGLGLPGRRRAAPSRFDDDF